VGAFHGLSRERSDARKYPSIHPLESWSKYPTLVDVERVEHGRAILQRGNEVGQMMKVVGEEGTSLDDYVVYMKSEFLDSVYLQQNAFDPVDAAVSTERQQHVFELIYQLLVADLGFNDKDEARTWFNQMRQLFLDYNGAQWSSDEFKRIEQDIRKNFAEKTASATAEV
jgi:V/A-type H+-transporting ATPase subunit A